VWHALLERAGRGHGERELTLLFTDLVGFSAWAVRAGDEDALALLQDIRAAAQVRTRTTVVLSTPWEGRTPPPHDPQAGVAT
jgi:class 3 adenylate cyclase